MANSQDEKKVQQYMRILCGMERGARYKNSNLLLIRNGEESQEERGRKNICPDTNLNPDYYNGKMKKTKKQQTPLVDDAFLSAIGYR